MSVLSDPGLYPFSVLALMVAGLLGLEILLMLVGLSSQIGDADVDAGLEIGTPMESLDALDLDPGLAATLEPVEPEALAADAGGSGILSMLGLTDAPSMIWLASLMAFLSMGGFALQGAVQALTGDFLSPMPALAIVALPALYATTRFARFLGRLVPSVTTTAISGRSFNRRRGRVSGGTAAVGRPAEVAWTDGHGNTHYLMAEPLDPADVIPEGASVLILKTREGAPRLVALS